MVRLLLGRLAGLVAVLFAISVMVFIIFNVIPGGDPALRLAGRHPTQQNIRQIRQDWGFDQPLYVQYVDMMNHLFIKRDLISYQDQTPVMPSIRRGIPRTLSLAIGAAPVWLVCGVTIGVLSGLYQGQVARPLAHCGGAGRRVDTDLLARAPCCSTCSPSSGTPTRCSAGFRPADTCR